MENKEPMETRCWRCGQPVKSDQKYREDSAIEFLYDYWTGDLKPMNNCAIVCRKCFDEYIIKAFGGLQQI